MRPCQCWRPSNPESPRTRGYLRHHHGARLETDQSEAKLIEFIDRSQIPIFTINVLQALPKTPLWERLAREGRLITDQDLESNVRFLRPRAESWRAGAELSHMPISPIGCSLAFSTRSMRPMQTAWVCRRRASSRRLI